MFRGIKVPMQRCQNWWVPDTDIGAERDINDEALTPVFVGVVMIRIRLSFSDPPPVDVGKDTTSRRRERGW